MENPVCNPITETNKAVPSFENIFRVLCVDAMISLLSFGISLFIINPMNMATNRIPAIPIEIPLIRILPIVKPATIMKNRRLIGESSIAIQSIIYHRIIAYEEDGYRDTSSVFYQFAYLCDNVRRTIHCNQYSALSHQAIFLLNDQYPV